MRKAPLLPQKPLPLQQASPIAAGTSLLNPNILRKTLNSAASIKSESSGGLTSKLGISDAPQQPGTSTSTSAATVSSLTSVTTKTELLEDTDTGLNNSSSAHDISGSGGDDLGVDIKDEIKDEMKTNDSEGTVIIRKIEIRQDREVINRDPLGQPTIPPVAIT